MFCAPRLIFGGTEGVGSLFSYFALQDSFSTVPRASCPIFTIYTTGLVSGGTGGVGSHSLVLRARPHFQRYKGRRVMFSCFVLRDSFSAVPSASGSVFMFCALGIVFGVTEGAGSRFHVLRSRTRFRRY
jgi:hypothetical protein